jgi:tRNA A37 methylthiotransferase MiaB
MVKRLSEFKDIHKGKKVIVCGCGVSLNLMKEYHQDFITIGVNDVPKLFTPTYLVVTDHSQRFAIPRRNLR